MSVTVYASIIGFRCGVEVCFYNWKEKINIMGYEEGFKRNAAYPPPTYNFFDFTLIPCSGLED